MIVVVIFVFIGFIGIEKIVYSGFKEVSFNKKTLIVPNRKVRNTPKTLVFNRIDIGTVGNLDCLENISTVIVFYFRIVLN